MVVVFIAFAAMVPVQDLSERTDISEPIQNTNPSGSLVFFIFCNEVLSVAESNQNHCSMTDG